MALRLVHAFWTSPVSMLPRQVPRQGDIHCRQMVQGGTWIIGSDTCQFLSWWAWLACLNDKRALAPRLALASHYRFNVYLCNASFDLFEFDLNFVFFSLSFFSLVLLSVFPHLPIPSFKWHFECNNLHQDRHKMSGTGEILLHPDALRCLKKKQLENLCIRLDLKASGKVR